MRVVARTRFRVLEKSLCLHCAGECVLCAVCARKTSARMWIECVLPRNLYALACTDFFQFLSRLSGRLFVCSSLLHRRRRRSAHTHTHTHSVHIRTCGPILVGLCCRWQRSLYTVKMLERCRCVAEIMSETAVGSVRCVRLFLVALHPKTDLSPSIVSFLLKPSPTTTVRR